MAVAAPSGATQRRDERIDRRRRRVADAALYLFATRGYNITSVEEIVARAKTSKSAFYEFFKSKEDCFRELLAQEGGALIHDVLATAASGHNHHERLRLGITRFVHSCFERSSVASLLIVESVGLSASVDEVRHELQSRFASAVAEEVRHAMAHDPFYADKDPQVFGRAVVGAVSDAVGYFLTHPGVDAESLAGSLCRIFAP
ncbi:MAG: TetR/AcrR family transcriptional regulator [Candidatus Dormibacteraeota bacterium]|nr:TetR/AcrR family transcriptional regulator [Candidatus Dormibacteraeota bacterium]